jgi:hypothetical protein
MGDTRRLQLFGTSSTPTACLEISSNVGYARVSALEYSSLTVARDKKDKTDRRFAKYLKSREAP